MPNVTGCVCAHLLQGYQTKDSYIASQGMLCIVFSCFIYDSTWCPIYVAVLVTLAGRGIEALIESDPSSIVAEPLIDAVSNQINEQCMSS